MSIDDKRPALLNLYVVLVAIIAIATFLDGLKADGFSVLGFWIYGFFVKGFWILASLVFVGVAKGLYSFRAWAWFFATFSCLFLTMTNFVEMIVSIDQDRSPFPDLFVCVFYAFSLWYLSRFSVERHYRPEIETADAH